MWFPDEQLIELVRGYKILYEKSSKSYKNVKVKAEIWKKIAETLGQSEIECTTRWKSLRDKFSRETKIKNLPSGSGAKVKPDWEYYGHLSFLSEHIKPRRTIGNVSDENQSDPSSPTPFTSSTSQIPFASPTFPSEHQSELLYETNLDCIIDEDSDTHSSAQSAKRVKANETVAKEICETMGVLKSFFNSKLESGNSSQNSIDFNGRANALLSGLSSDSRAKAEKRIIAYLCKCQLAEFEVGHVNDVEM